jgi:uncharacterized protein YndB with AHSA1/START domain
MHRESPVCLCTLRARRSAGDVAGRRRCWIETAPRCQIAGEEDAVELEYSIAIDATPERVWEVMADVERWPEWTASMSEVRLVEGDRLAVGARARVRQPKLPPATLEVTAFEPLRGFTWVANSPGVTFVGTHALAPADRGVTVTLGVSFRGALAGIVGLFTSRMTRRYVQLEAEGLKRRSESPV